MFGNLLTHKRQIPPTTVPGENGRYSIPSLPGENMGEWPITGHSGSDSGLENRDAEMNKDPGTVTLVQTVPTAE